VYVLRMQFEAGERPSKRVHRVGVIGASAPASSDGSPTAVATTWAAHSHIPAIAAAPNVTLTAVATSRRESAERSASAFGATHAFTSAAELSACDDVDLVVVSVRSPGHAQAVEAALMAGKPVWCEWPIGVGSETTRHLTGLAREHGVTTVAGLQGRFDPAVAYARRLLDDGYVGRLLAVRAYAEYDAWGETIAVGYSADAKAKAHIRNSGGGHILEILTYLAGDVRDVTGTLSYQFDSGYALDLQRRVPMTAPDQFTAHGVLTSGAVFSAHVLGAAPHGSPFGLHLIGTEGRLVLETDGMPQISPPTLRGARGADALAVLSVPDSDLTVAEGLQGPAVAMAGAYSHLPDDLSAGADPLPDFEHGLKIHRVLDAITTAARSGTRESL
jgi:predicted dehydrogenase